MVIALHAGVFGVAALWKMEVIKPEIIRTKLFEVPNPQPEPEPELPRPPHQAKPEQPTRLVLPKQEVPVPPVTDGPVAPTFPDPPMPTFDAGPPMPPAPPAPPRIEQAARARGDLRSLITADDYPDAALRMGDEGTVQVRLGIGTSGKVTDCTVVASSGSTALDNATCRILKSRARFTPAKDSNGQAATDSMVSPKIVWRLIDN
jgi:protein TonB